MSTAAVYDSEYRTVCIVRLVVNLAGCTMIYTGKADHPFLQANRRLMALTLLLMVTSMLLAEASLSWPSSQLHFAIIVTFISSEACIATLVLLGCVLLRSITLKESYRLNNVFYLALLLQIAALATDNTIKFGYLANSIIAAVALSVLREFLTVFQGDGTEAQNVNALIRLQALLTVLNLATFIASMYYKVLGLKLAQYVLQIFTVTLFYLFVRPYVEPAAVQGADKLELLEAGGL